jgi:hypothetical protein
VYRLPYVQKTHTRKDQPNQSTKNQRFKKKSSLTQLPVIPENRPYMYQMRPYYVVQPHISQQFIQLQYRQT